MNYQGIEYYYISNRQADIIGMMDGSGNIVVKYSYDAWGNFLYQWTSVTNLDHINPYRYRGYRYDVETNLYYLNARYYDPSIARFISADDVSFIADDQAPSINIYAYTLNNPVMYLDPSGEFAGAIPLLPVIAIAFVILFILALFSDEIAQFVDSAIDSIESEIEKSLKKEYTVYTLVDGDGVVRYVGRVKTKNYNARMKYLEQTKGLYPGDRIDNLNYWECRGIEQLGIIGNATGMFDLKTNPGGNKINGIGLKNPMKYNYYHAGIRYIWNNIENELNNMFH